MNAHTLLPSSYSVLRTLASGPRHGWSVLQELRNTSRRAPAIATIYATLERLEAAAFVQRGSVEIVDGRARILFQITDEGLGALRSHAAELHRDASTVLAMNGVTA